MKFLRENWSSLLTILLLIVVGILVLVNPDLYTTIIIRVVGVLLTVLGIYDIVKYFRSEPMEAAKGSGFYSGVIMVTAGAFCIFRLNTLKSVFPMMAVLYGVFQIVLGYRKLQRMVDALRMKLPLWWLQAISAGISLLFGYLIALNPGMTLMNIWVFTGITMIIEGVFDAASLFVRLKNRESNPEKSSEETMPDPAEQGAEPCESSSGVVQ